MQLLPVHYLAILVVSGLVNSQGLSVSDHGCVSSFLKAPYHFEVCKTRLCFVILPERPIVIAEPVMKSAPSRPFRCLDNKKYSGVFFDILKRAGQSVPEIEQAMCTYGGPNCSFDNTVRFVGDTAKLNATYHFIAGGSFIFLPNRRTLYTVHSQPWASGKMVVLVRQDGVQHSFQSAWEQVFQPFRIQGWVVLVVFMFMLCVALAIHVRTFSQVKSFRELIRWFALSRPSDRGVWETASWSSLSLAVAVFFAVSILLYEISYIILSDTENINDIEELRSFGLHNYAVVEGDASETIFRYAVGWQNEKGKVPWIPVRTLNAALALVRNGTVKYAFSYDTMAATILRRDNLCDEVYAIPTQKRDSAGWYYSVSIPRKLRQKIDHALGTLALEDLPRKSMKAFGMSELNCGNLAGQLDYKVLLFILLLTVGPILLKQIAALIFSRYWPDIENPDIPANVSPQMEPEADPVDRIPEASNSSSSSSQISLMSRITKNNSSPF